MLVAFSAACFGSIAIAVTIAQRNGLPLIATLAWRYGAGAVLLVLLAGHARRAMFQVSGLLPFVLLGTMQALLAAVSLSALQFISAATLSFLFYTYPAWIAVIAAARGTEPLTAARAIALALALMGIAVMVGTPGPGDVHMAGVLLALGSALLYAIYVPVIEAFSARHGGPAAATYAAGGAAVVLVAAAVLLPGSTGGLRLPGTVAAWGAVAWLAVFTTAIAFLTFLRGLAVLGPVRSGIVSTIEPFVTAILAALLLGQPLTLATLGGGACVAGAVLLLQRAHMAPSPAREPRTEPQ